MKKITVSLCLLFFISIPAHAKEAEGVTALEKGKIFFQQKSYEQAYLALHQAFMQDPTDLNVSFFMGRAAFEQAMLSRVKGDEETAQRRLEAALMAFDRVLIVQPGAIRVKLEIARCHMELGSFEIAKQHFHEVLDSNPPESVKKNIDFLLAAIASSEERHYFSGMASLGISFDDNVRSGPPAGTVTAKLGILEFQAGDPVKDQIMANIVAVSHTYNIPETPYSWKSSVLVFNNFYDSYKDLDLSMIGISTGPAFQGDRILLDVSTHLNNIMLGWDEYVRPFGIGSSITYLLDPRVILTSSITLEKKIYAKNSDESKDATNLLINFSPSLILDDNRFTFNLATERESANVDYWCYDKLSWGLRYDRVLPHDLTAYASFDAKATDYDATNTPATDTIARKDTVYVYTVGLAAIFWKSKKKDRNLSLQVTHTFTDARSNISRSNYEKNVFASTLSYSF